MAKKRKKLDLEENIDKYLTISISTIATKTFVTIQGFIEKMKSLGMSNEVIREGLLKDLNNNGVIFGEFNRALQKSVSGTINLASAKASRNEFFDQVDDTQYTWVCVFNNTCEDCLARHGQTETSETWDLLGTPPTWGSVCDPFCQCNLIPTSVVNTRTELKDPIKRAKQELKKMDLSMPDFENIETAEERKAARVVGQINQKKKG